ncbi:hypothetical protein V6Z11_A03G138500 [Gossypium hirsutum]|uniref:Uncharacterized protein n=1 Tax=Gossypium hirsutum TaxID=3635 RepID=A0A1U8HMV6_GOSHI|nr:putative protein TPRXL [Gossypium hirsutum]
MYILWFITPQAVDLTDGASSSSSSPLRVSSLSSLQDSPSLTSSSLPQTPTTLTSPSSSTLHVTSMPSPSHFSPYALPLFLSSPLCATQPPSPSPLHATQPILCLPPPDQPRDSAPESSRRRCRRWPTRPSTQPALPSASSSINFVFGSTKLPTHASPSE